MSKSISDLQSNTVSRRAALKSVASDLELHLAHAESASAADDAAVVANALRHARAHAKAIRDALSDE